MTSIKRIAIILFLLSCSQLQGQIINEQLSIIPKCDTSDLEIHIGEIHYFGKNTEKAKAYPQLIACFKAEKRYIVIWVSSKRYKKRVKIKYEHLKEYVFDKKDNGFEKFPCFTFVIDQEVKTFPDGKFISGLKIPSQVVVHKYEYGKWIHLFDKNVTSHEELGALQLEVIKNC